MAKKRGCRGKYSELAPVVLQRLTEGDNITTACRHAGIHVDSFYSWLNKKPEFSEAVKKAQETFRANIQAKLEATLWEKALGGKRIEETTTEYAAGPDGKPIIVKQRKIAKTTNPDTGALIFALTNVDPEKWKNRQKQDVEARVNTFEQLMEELPDENDLPEIKQ